MDGSSQFTEIIFFACVAIFLGLRLRSLLGRRGEDDPPPPENNNVHPFPGAAPSAPPSHVAPHVAYVRPVADPLTSTLAHIRAQDPNFDPAVFLDGAKMAFRLIVEAYARGDEAALRPLLDDVVYGPFSHSIEERRKAQETCLSELLEMVSADLVEAQLEGRQAHLTVRFVSRQNILVKNAAGEVIEGSPDRPVQLTDYWSFSRDLRSPSPNWLLVATRSGEE